MKHEARSRKYGGGLIKLLFFTLLLYSLFVLFAPVAHAAWYNSNYTYCRKMTMTAGGTSGGVATTTTGFALAATSTISTLAATSSSGRIFETTTNAHGTTTPVDIVMTNGSDCNTASGSEIDFYFEKYVETTGEFVLWVESPTVSSTTAQTVLMYYGFADNSAVDQSDESGVFDGGLSEVGVWNLSEDPTAAGAGGILDSTSNNYDGTDTGSMNSADQVAGQVDGSLNFDGSDDHISFGDINEIDGLSSLSFSAWIQVEDLGVDSLVISKGSFSQSGVFHVWRDDIGAVSGRTNTVSAEVADGTNTVKIEGAIGALNDNNWHHVAMTYIGNNANGLRLYIDGVEDANSPADTSTVTALNSNGSNLHLGESSISFAKDFTGNIDDVRIYSQALHVMDLLTIYNNTADSTTFWTFGSEETQTTSADSLRALGAALAAQGDSAGVQDGGTLTINGESLGSFDYVVYDGSTTTTTFVESDWFSATADSKAAVVVVNGDLTIPSGQTFTPGVRKLFTFLYVTGNLTVNGTTTMTARGADHSAATGSNVTAAAIRIANGAYSSVTNPEIPAAGGSGAPGGLRVGTYDGVDGSAGSAGGTGGGGEGSHNGSTDGTTGSGVAGTSFSGGGGGGGVRNVGDLGGVDAAIDGGPGGDGDLDAGGGAGNPGGTGLVRGIDGEDGTGGTLVIITLGTFSGTGIISADGSDGGGTSPLNRPGGAGSGGGSVTVLYGTDSSSIVPTTNGGAGGVGAQIGGDGGAGTARKLMIPNSRIIRLHGGLRLLGGVRLR